VSTGSTLAVPTQPVSASASGGCSNAYYPIPSGASWSYASTGGNLGPYTYTETVTPTSDTGFTTSYQFSTGVNPSIKWSCQSGNLAALDAGAGSLSFTAMTATMTSETTTANGYTIPASFSKGNAWSQNVTATGTVTSNGRQVTSQISDQISCTAAGADTITVPAGTFDTAKATCTKNVVVSAIVQGKTMQLGASKENTTSWYAKGVGFVKSVATGGNNNETIVLTADKIQ
jgi:hypothetical protein